jgi:hypothetical protein
LSYLENVTRDRVNVRPYIPHCRIRGVSEEQRYLDGSLHGFRNYYFRNDFCNNDSLLYKTTLSFVGWLPCPDESDAKRNKNFHLVKHGLLS